MAREDERNRSRVRPFPIFASCLTAVIMLVWAASPLVAQRGSTTQSKDPTVAARTLFEQRVSAGEAAKELMGTHRQAPADALRLLAGAGYRRTDVAATAVKEMGLDAGTAARTLRTLGISADVVVSSFTSQRIPLPDVSRALVVAAFPAVEAMKAVVTGTDMEPLAALESLQLAGFSVGDLSAAVTELGMPLDLGCVGPDGSPAPCGNFGQGDNQPVMGQLTWWPQGSAAAGTVVTFESVNIPPVDVLLDGQPLEILEMGPNRVRARLPDAPANGPLAFRRQADGVLGVIEEDYEVVVTAPVVAVNWSEAANAAFAGAMADADAWIAGSRFDEAFCTVLGPSALGAPGVLRNPTGFQGEIANRLRARGVPEEVAEAWQASFEGAFLAWADNVTIPGLPLYPAFAAFPGAEAPPLANVPVPLATLISAGAVEMTQPMLYQRLKSTLPGAESSEADAAIVAFALELGTSFEVFLGAAQVMLVMGRGPVPAFSPPTVPVGPVVEGSCWSPTFWAALLPSGAKVDLPDIG